MCIKVMVVLNEMQSLYDGLAVEAISIVPNEKSSGSNSNIAAF